MQEQWPVSNTNKLNNILESSAMSVSVLFQGNATHVKTLKKYFIGFGNTLD